ncbi:hypothetical protein LWI28_011938 [Acer negundo]|uniref:Uncharacterized protein n=1 Tax=Acer negundo TaxID=4023 RepID=A0AAD5IEC9_ACENE|nr:hypothetical protein LWI28_011938 [Acer negundo]
MSKAHSTTSFPCWLKENFIETKPGKEESQTSQKKQKTGGNKTTTLQKAEETGLTTENQNRRRKTENTKQRDQISIMRTKSPQLLDPC